MWPKERKKSIVMGLVIMLALVPVGTGSLLAGTLDPPASAFDTSGNPVPTTVGQPSWDKKLPVAERFVVVMDGAAVLDKETWVVWEREPTVNDTGVNWEFAHDHCMRSEVGGRKGWHLPTIEQLQSIIDSSQFPALPAGHPFLPLPGDLFPGSHWWSATSGSSHTGTFVDPQPAVVVEFKFGNHSFIDKDNRKWDNFPVLAWCVRGGKTFDGQDNDQLIRNSIVQHP